MHSLSHIYFDTRHKNHKPILNIIIKSNIPFLYNKRIIRFHGNG